MIKSDIFLKNVYILSNIEHFSQERTICRSVSYRSKINQSFIKRSLFDIIITISDYMKFIIDFLKEKTEVFNYLKQFYANV